MTNISDIPMSETTIERTRQAKADRLAKRLGVSKITHAVGELIFCGYSVYELVYATLDRLEEANKMTDHNGDVNKMVEPIVVRDKDGEKLSGAYQFYGYSPQPDYKAMTAKLAEALEVIANTEPKALNINGEVAGNVFEVTIAKKALTEYSALITADKNKEKI